MNRMRKLFLFLVWTLLALSAVLPVIVAAVIRLATNAWPTWAGVGLFALPDGTYLPPKTLWDLWQLLLIPIVLAVIAWLFTRSERIAREQNEQRRFGLENELAEKRSQLERELALEAQRDGALRAYFDSMTQLLLQYGLTNLSEGTFARDIAHGRTVAVLRMLDGHRKKDVLHFLFNAGLVVGKSPIISVQFTDFSGIDLGRYDLSSINLSGANLSGANLTEVNLDGAYLVDTNLSKCNLTRARISRTDLSYAKLGGIDLSSCEINGITLTFATWDSETVWPMDHCYFSAIEYDPEMHSATRNEI